MNIYTTIFVLCALLLCLSLQVCVAGDNITTGTPITDASHETIVSSSKMFELGFFTPQGSVGESRYVGIWYYFDNQTVVWVANRDKPLTGSTGVIVVAEDGNLKVLDIDDQNTTYFTTGLDNSESSFRRLELRDTGNLVLVDNNSSSMVWQSFTNSTDTFLPGMKMDENVKLTSWKSQHDPASGNFTFQQDTEGQNRYVIYKELTTTYWKSGKVGSSFNPSSQMFGAAAVLLSNFSRQVSMQIRSNIYRGLMLPSGIDYNYSRLIMSYTGEIQYWNWSTTTKAWIQYWSEPKDNCSIYKACGTFGMCNVTIGCSCLPGFEPIIPEKWRSGDFTSGCKRTYDICGNDTFLNLTMIGVGESNLPFIELGSEQYCKEKCLKNCQCQAYSYNPGNNDNLRSGRPGGKAGCWIWESELVNLQQGDADSEHNLSIRIANSTGLNNSLQSGLNNSLQSGLDNNHRQSPTFSMKPLVISAITLLVILILCGMSYIAYQRMMTTRQARHENFLIEPRQFREDNEDIDVPFFEFKSLVAATDDFSDANKLGQGGFGPVYKGMLHGGIEIAVKRLSSHSVQGLEEFRNEVVLIAKLQHRNLVRLLGYSMKGYEKILVYEYMPNKSLDTFIFDRTLCMLLNWTKRFDIILGIAQGLLYLHRDSRLRIIHRDLKTSNILLDAEMNPKISDFGLARIVGGNETEASTNRVVGTYGYMSPEYAIEGTFSVKSDVFSFGVVVLEIISGKKNTAIYLSQQIMNRLLGYAWSLWKEEKALDLMDEALGESCNQIEFLKCLIVGLLCVQEDPSDRPTMANVVWMLGGDITSLPNPKQPAFGARKRFSSSPSSSSSKPETHTSNEMTISKEEGR